MLRKMYDRRCCRDDMIVLHVPVVGAHTEHPCTCETIGRMQLVRDDREMAACSTVWRSRRLGNGLLQPAASTRCDASSCSP